LHMYDKYIGPIFIQSSYCQWEMAMLLLDWPLYTNLKTAWLGSTCCVSAYAIRTYSISVMLMCIFKLISKETCNTKKVTFHVYFYYVKFHFDRSKGKKLHF